MKSIVTLILMLITFFSIPVSFAHKTESMTLEKNTAHQQFSLKGLKEDQLNKIQYCQQDLAQKLGVKKSHISVIKYEPVIWNNGALGCPTLGKHYTQGQVKGARITLEANSNKYYYHASSNGVPFYCAKPKIKKPTPLYQDR